METLAIGIDVVEIERIRSVYQRHPRRFIERVYTDDEQTRLTVLRDPAPYLAGRWAVKESVLKVLGTGLTGGIRWRDINVVRLQSGAPSVELSGKARERADAIGLQKILVTITHGRELAIAQAQGFGYESSTDTARRGEIDGT